MFIELATDNCSVEAWCRASAQTLAAFRPFPAANVGDAQDRFGLVHSAIRAQSAGARCVGSALTVLTREGDNLAIHRALDEARSGDVLVVSGLGDETRALFGDLLAEVCLVRGVAGVVLDGVTRDVAAIAELGLPVWARGSTAAGPTKTGPGRIGVPVAIGGVVVNPGDIVVGDTDGVAVVPRDRAGETLDRLAKIESFEEGLRERIRATRVAAS
jgi:regulator of RNase E activity RraA